MEYAHSLELIKVPLVLALVMSCCVTDISERRIPNLLLLPVLVAAFFLNTLGGGLAGFTDSFGGLLIGTGMLLPLYVLGRMGAGDIKLLGVVGAILGTWGAIVAGLATMMAGGILGVVYLSWLLAKPAVVSRVSRFTGFIKSEVEQHQDAVPLDSVRAAEIPYAVAIAAGTVATLIYLGLLLEVKIT